MTERRVRRWSELSARESRELLDEYVACHEARLSAFLDEVRARQGPIEQLDFTRESLGPLWVWITATYPPAPASDDQMWSNDPPWWYAFHSPLGQRIGPDLARIVTGTAAYLAETIRRTRPGVTWVTGKYPNGADFRQPLLKVPGGGAEFLPDSSVLVAANQWADGIIVSDSRLIDFYDVRAGRGEGPRPRTFDVPEGDEPYNLERDRSERLDTVISFDHAVAHEDEDRLKRLVAALAREPGVDQAVWEDREIVLLAAPRLDDQTIRDLVDRLWSSV
jgi:hypothetical protein